MVDRQLINQLQSINASQRREAIIALGRTKDREAIPHLSRVVEVDPDEALRELARKAAIYIDKNAPVVNVKPFKMPWDDLEEEEELSGESDTGRASETIDPVTLEYAPPSPDEISARQDLEWAERFIDRAWQSYYMNDKAGAESNLRKAFERSAEIAENENAREAAGKIMGMNPDRAVAALLKPRTQRRPGSISKKPGTSSARPPSSVKKPAAGAKAAAVGRAEKTVDEIEDGNFGRALLDTFIFFAIVFAIGFATIYFGAQLLNSRYDLSSPGAANDPSVQAMRPVLEATVGEQAVLNTAAYAAISAGSNTVTYLITSFVTHMVAVTLLGGNGTMPRLIRKTFLYYALVNPVLIILIIVAAFLSVLIDFEEVLLLAIGLLSVGAILFLAWRISVAYRFDIGRGCMTMILTVVGYICLGVSLVFILVALGVGPFAQLALSFN